MSCVQPVHLHSCERATAAQQGGPTPSVACGVWRVACGVWRMAAAHLVLAVATPPTQAGSKLSDRNMLSIFTDLLGFVSEEDKLVDLLSMVPGSSPLGCLAPISGALFHPLAEVRAMAAKVLAIIDGYKAAKSTVSGLNMFLLLGYDTAVAARPVAVPERL